jgi:hypothetical protein
MIEVTPTEFQRTSFGWADSKPEIDRNGQSLVSRLIASFIQPNPGITIELSLSSQALI